MFPAFVLKVEFLESGRYRSGSDYFRSVVQGFLFGVGRLLVLGVGVSLVPLVLRFGLLAPLHGAPDPALMLWLAEGFPSMPEISQPTP